MYCTSTLPNSPNGVQCTILVQVEVSAFYQIFNEIGLLYLGT